MALSAGRGIRGGGAAVEVVVLVVVVVVVWSWVAGRAPDPCAPAGGLSDPGLRARRARLRFDLPRSSSEGASALLPAQNPSSHT